MSKTTDVKESTVEKVIERVVRSGNGKVSPDVARREIADRANRINNERKGK